MPTFLYRALREPGRPLQGEIEADSLQAAAMGLIARGYHVLEIEDRDSAAGKRALPRLGFWGGLRRKDLTRLTRDLATLLRAGVPLSQGLAMLASRKANAAWQPVLHGLRSQIEDGRTFHQALRSYPDVFSSMYIALVRAGEEGATLVESLLRLVAAGEAREEIGARLRMALVYPAVMLGVGTITVGVMLVVVVPMFEDVFRQTAQTLPLPTQLLVMTSRFLQTWWWLLLLATAGVLLLLSRYMNTPGGRRLADLLCLKLPIFGGLLRAFQVVTFTRTTASLLGSGLPIVDALRIAAQSVGNTLYQEAILAMRKEVQEGTPMSEAIERQPLFPDTLASILQVGERSGEMAPCLSQVAEDASREVERQVKVIMTMIEPAMIILLGMIVGFIVVAMLLPIFMLGDSMQI